MAYTVVEEQGHPSFPAQYTIVLVEIDDAEGARLIGSIAGRPALTIGMAMEAWFEEAEGCTLPQWRPTTD